MRNLSITSAIPGFPLIVLPACWDDAARSAYVGTEGIATVLIRSPEGDVLIGGGLPDSAPLIAENLRTLGFDVGEVKLILNSHAHFDHAGGLAALQSTTEARLVARPASAAAIREGRYGPGDPQCGGLGEWPLHPSDDKPSAPPQHRHAGLVDALSPLLSPGAEPGVGAPAPDEFGRITSVTTGAGGRLVAVVPRFFYLDDVAPPIRGGLLACEEAGSMGVQRLRLARLQRAPES